MLFVGAYERQLDDKGRLALPSRFRSGLGEHCYVAKGPGMCLTVVPAAVFEAEAEAMRARVAAKEVPLNHLRALAGSAQQVTIDKQGRINVDEQLRTYAELRTEAAVTVAGAFDRLEIWTPDRYARRGRRQRRDGRRRVTPPNHHHEEEDRDPTPRQPDTSTHTPMHTSPRPSAASRAARWTAHTPPASVSHDRGDIPAAPAIRGAADGRW